VIVRRHRSGHGGSVEVNLMLYDDDYGHGNRPKWKWVLVAVAGVLGTAITAMSLLGAEVFVEIRRIILRDLGF
jgi:hypothetical protein